ncbi:hypothetical protein RhiXN_00334 [Rhizoctonia solani]|uniref:RmlD-like substrate binding domain-containing protein n=1 Tax=Rhizoctonia solani TaxID=456999 RepID=A0A8H8SW82_9AGAM|nr:uncharacterized protein RhiXN_00334 [Rhizoctonia solani]QRW18928.1 hypothetical protein RhiXN_00334 [Rhizoctonia solani]
MNVEAQAEAVSLRALERDEVNEHKYVGLAHAQRHVTCGDERVVHCAAERRPDVAAKNVEATWTLNGAVPATLARLSSTKEHSFTLIYISTDYVFDGTAAPYSVDAKPNPVNLYGETKLAGERAVLDDGYQGKPGQRVVLRVPVLYGPAPKNSDSAINILVDIVNDQSGKQYTMDHYATRYPTNVLDIADFLVRLAVLDKPLPSILHYSGTEPYTKYEICLVLAKILNVPHNHITPDAADPPPNLAISRPKNTQLSLEILDNIGVEVGGRDFAIWWEQYLLSKN